MTAKVEQWEASVAELWGRFDSFDRDAGASAMRESAAACPTADGRAAFELAGMYDSMGFEAEAGAEYERALELGLDEARCALALGLFAPIRSRMGLLTFSINVTVDGCVDHEEGIADDETHAFAPACSNSRTRHRQARCSAAASSRSSWIDWIGLTSTGSCDHTLKRNVTT